MRSVAPPTRSKNKLKSKSFVICAINSVFQLIYILYYHEDWFLQFKALSVLYKWIVWPFGMKILNLSLSKCNKISNMYSLIACFEVDLFLFVAVWFCTMSVCLKWYVCFVLPVCFAWTCLTSNQFILTVSQVIYWGCLANNQL